MISSGNVVIELKNTSNLLRPITNDSLMLRGHEFIGVPLVLRLHLGFTELKQCGLGLGRWITDLRVPQHRRTDSSILRTHSHRASLVLGIFL